MGYTFEQAVQIVQARRSSQETLIRYMIDVRDRYNGDFVLPLENSGDGTWRRSLTPQLIAEAVDAPALRASTLMPQMIVPANNDAVETGRNSREYARKRARAIAATYHRNRWPLKARRFFRHLGGYGTAAVAVLPGRWMGRPGSASYRDEDCIPQLQVRDPLTAYPDPRAPEDLDLPRNVGFVTQRSAAWIRYNLNYEIPEGSNVSDLYDVLEWMDDKFIRIGVMGPTPTPDRRVEDVVVNPYEIAWWPNLCAGGIVPAVVPKIVTLDKIISRLASMIGKVDMLAYLRELDIEATRRSIAPDRYAISEPERAPEIVSGGGKWQPGETGEMNLLQNVRAVGELRSSPDPNNKLTMRELQRDIQVDSGLVSPYIGETFGALRTGRGIDSLMASSADPRIMELHEIGAEMMRCVNTAILATFVGYEPERDYKLYSGWPSDQGHVAFRPRTHFSESFESVVRYPFPGMDVGQVTVEVGQLAQAELMSRRTARTLHPHIDDAEAEDRQVLEESIDGTLLASWRQRAMSGGIPPIDVARLRALIREGKTLDEATTIVDAEARERQAAQAPPAPEGFAAAPATQPGLGNPGEGGEVGAGAPGGPPPIAALVSALQAQGTP